jgi:hypothetical protein
MLRKQVRYITPNLLHQKSIKGTTTVTAVTQIILQYNLACHLN